MAPLAPSRVDARLIYLTGATNDADEPGLVAAGVGLMLGPGNSYHLRVDRYPWFAADNGCFTDKWVEDTHLAWLDQLPRDRCLFAVAPDVYPDAAATLERSRRYFDLMRGMGFPVALVAQDGAERLDLPWEDFDALFIGGERKPHARDEWKVSPAAAGLARLARSHGKWVHMGRVNSLRRLDLARQMGCLSADGTYVKYTRRARQRDDAQAARGGVELARWHAWLAMHPPMSMPTETPAHPTHRQAVAS